MQRKSSRNGQENLINFGSNSHLISIMNALCQFTSTGFPSGNSYLLLILSKALTINVLNQNYIKDER